MGKYYSQLSLNERVEIYHLLESGLSLNRIARTLGRHRCTISREIARNGQARAKRRGRYCAIAADKRAVGRRHRDKRFKLARQPALRARVRDYLAMGWSPAQISGRLALEQGAAVISHESIYRYVYHRSSDNIRDYWCRALPQRKYRRGKMQRGCPMSLHYLKDRISIHDRPCPIEAREVVGHWEIDSMLFSRPGQNILVSCERKTRYINLAHTADRTAERIARYLLSQFRALPEFMRRSATFDNGPEFTDHAKLGAVGMQTYFCDIRAPWQKGSVENTIGRLRRWLPRKTDLNEISPQMLRKISKRYNQTPRKCLGFKTPAEVFLEQLLHFKCESTFRLSPE